MENKADYQISSSVNNGIFEVVLTGKSIGLTNEKMANELDDIIKANNAEKVLMDVRAVEGRLDSTEIYRYTRNHYFVIYKLQVAVVDLSENAHYATAVKNAGLPFTWFIDIDEARAWLNSKQRK
jgi:hypothetical protein